MKDHYKTLGVAETATQAQIKTAYRKLAIKHHPDKGGDTAEFQKIQAAYAVLGDAERRAKYDATGDDRPVAEPMSVEQEAIGHLQTLLVEIVTGCEYPEYTDLIKRAKELVVAKRAEVAKEKSTFEKKVRRLTTAMPRFAHPTDSSLFSSVAQGTINQLNGELVKLNRALEVLVEILRVLTVCSYRVDEDQKPQKATASGLYTGNIDEMIAQYLGGSFAAFRTNS